MPKALVAIISLLLLVGCQASSEGSRTSNSENYFPERTTLAGNEIAVNKSSEITILYVSAWNCPPCWRYKENAHPIWLKSKEYKHVKFRELEFPIYEYTGGDKYWPPEFRWIRTKTFSTRGAPRWIVLVDEKIVSNQKSWSKTYSLIHQIVARKLEV